MAPKTKKKPTPEELLIEVKGQSAAKTYEFEDYIEVIDELQRKEHSYAEIAEFLKSRLGFTASRGQVYRALTLWRAQQEAEALQAAEAEQFGDQFEPPEGPEEHYVAAAGKFQFETGNAVLNFLLEHCPEDELPPMASYKGILESAIAVLDRDKADEMAAEAEDLKKTKGGKNEPGK